MFFGTFIVVFFFIKNVWRFIISALNDNHALLLFAERTEQKSASIYVDSGGCLFKGSYIILYIHVYNSINV
jgi:hypothetical protein